jgi:RHS repeat-associated protein
MIASDAAGTPWLYAGKGTTSDGLDIAELDLSTWGEVVRSDGKPGTLRFAGQRADERTGLHYNRHRYYAPDLHVFITPDPLGIVGSFQDVGFVPNATIYIDPLGLTIIVLGSRGDKAIESHRKTTEQQYPGATVLYHDELGPTSLAGEDHVIVSTHGCPGYAEWGDKKRFLGIPYGRRPMASGQDIGNNLKNAGFTGSRVDMYACNAATPQQNNGPSLTQGVADATGATVGGARSDDPAGTYAGTTRDISGKKWYQFWRKPNNWGPGMMAPTGPSDIYIEKGHWETTGPSSP